MQNYCNIHHDKNPAWYEIAEIWRPFLIQELNTLYSTKIPTFVTSSKLLQSLMPQTINKMNIKEYSVNLILATIIKLPRNLWRHM